MDKESSNQSLPILFVSRIEVKSNQQRDYLEILHSTSSAIRATESELILQLINKDSALSEQYVCTEIFISEDSLLKHINNPPYCLYLANHNQLASSIKTEIYGTISPETKAVLEGRFSSVTYFENEGGYSKIAKV